MIRVVGITLLFLAAAFVWILFDAAGNTAAFGRCKVQFIEANAGRRLSVLPSVRPTIGIPHVSLLHVPHGFLGHVTAAPTPKPLNPIRLASHRIAKSFTVSHFKVDLIFHSW